MTEYCLGEDRTLIACTTDEACLAIPGNIRSIAARAFAGNAQLRQVVIPASVAKIGDGAFADCPQLEIVQMRPGVQKIGTGAFSHCSALTTVELGEGLEEIGEDAFRLCTHLTALRIPDSVRSIAYRAFFGCSGMTGCVLPAGLTQLAEELFSGCGSLSRVDIPAGVTQIGRECFSGCGSLTSLTLPAGLVTVGNMAFADCRALTCITAVDDYQPDHDRQLYAGCQALTRFIVPEGVREIRAGAFRFTPFLEEIILPGSLEKIGRDAFTGCESLRKITFPERLREIGEGAFSDCHGLTGVALPRSLRRVGEQAFSGCIKLRSFLVPPAHPVFRVTDGGLTDTERGILLARPMQQKAKKVCVPQGVLRIGAGAFRGDPNLEEVYLPEGVTGIGERAFAQCVSLKKVCLPGSLQVIEAAAFMGCGMESLTLPEGLTTLGPSALSCCEDLTGLELPEGLTVISHGLLADCTALRRVTLPQSIRRIEQSAFAGCTALDLLVIPDSVKERLQRIVDPSDRTLIHIRDIVLLPQSVRHLALLCLARETDEPDPVRLKAHLKEARGWVRRLYAEMTAPPQDAENLTLGRERWPAMLRLLCRYHLLTARAAAQYMETAQKDGSLELISMLMTYQAEQNRKTLIREEERRAAEENEVFDRAMNRLGKEGLDGLRFSLAGKPEPAVFPSRDAFTRFLRSHGADFCEKVTSRVDYLILQPNEAESVNSRQAVRLGIETLTWDDFYAMSGLMTGQCLVRRGVLLRVAGTAQELVIPEGVTAIAAGALLSLANTLQRIVLPDSLTSLEDDPFGGLLRLASLEAGPDHPAFRSVDGVLYDRDLTRLVRYPAARSENTFTVPVQVTAIAEHAFAGAIRLTGILGLDHVTQVGWYAFAGCSALRELPLPPLADEVGCGTFMGCMKLTEVSLSARVRAVYPQAFAGCTGLTCLSLHAGAAPDPTAFSGCASVTEIFLSGDDADLVRSAARALHVSLPDADLRALHLCDPRLAPEEWQAAALAGFAHEAFRDLSSARGQAHLRFLRAMSGPLMPIAVRDLPLLQLVRSVGLPDAKQLPVWREAAERAGNEAAVRLLRDPSI